MAVESSKLNDLEDRWRSSGAIEDETALLAARLQAGLLSESRVALAAHAGYEAARRALGAAAPPLPSSFDWEDLHPWIEAFPDWGEEAAERAALAAVEVAWTKWAPHFEESIREHFGSVLEIARRAVGQQPDARQRAAAAAAVDLARGCLSGAELPPGSGYVLDAVVGLLSRLLFPELEFTARLPVHNARFGPDGRITHEVCEAISDRVGRWALYGED